MRLRAGRCAGLFLLLALAAFARAARAEATTESILYGTSGSETLRARLAQHAAAAADPADAALAWLRRGESFARAALPDSAIASFRRAAAAGELAATPALIDALLRRRAAGDVAESIRLLESEIAGREAGGDPSATGYRARLAWAVHLDGRSSEADEQLRPLATVLGSNPKWRYRLARIALAAGDPRRAYDLVRPLLVQTRRQDAELVTMLGEIGSQTGRQRLVEDDVARSIGRHDALEAAAMTSLRARRVRFPARDGEFVSAILFEPPARRRPVPAIVAMAPGDSIAPYDSLVTRLREAGFVVAVVEPRGTGWSVSENCPSPDTWEGREELLQSRVATDLLDALAALRAEAQADTTRALAIGVGAMAPALVEAADLEARFTALVLVSPSVAWVDRGAALDRLRRLQLPLFLQVGPEDQLERAFLDSLYRASPERESRVSEARAVGSGVTQFGREPGSCTRLVRWATEATAQRRGRRGR
jgi:dienelactone hydrolase